MSSRLFGRCSGGVWRGKDGRVGDLDRDKGVGDELTKHQPQRHAFKWSFGRVPAFCGLPRLLAPLEGCNPIQGNTRRCRGGVLQPARARHPAQQRAFHGHTDHRTGTPAGWRSRCGIFAAGKRPLRRTATSPYELRNELESLRCQRRPRRELAKWIQAFNWSHFRLATSQCSQGTKGQEKGQAHLRGTCEETTPTNQAQTAEGGLVQAHCTNQKVCCVVHTL